MPDNNSNHDMKAAGEIETKHIKDYEEKNGRKPKGNVRY